MRRKRKKNEKGQAMVEFALILPIFLLVICGIIDFGWLFYNQLSLNNDCREAARYIVVNSEKSDLVLEEHILEVSSPMFEDKLTVYINFTNSTDKTQGDVIVALKTDMVVLTPVMSAIVRGTTRTLTATATMKVES